MTYRKRVWRIGDRQFPGWYFLFNTLKLTKLGKDAPPNQNREMWCSYGLQILAVTAFVNVTQFVSNCKSRDFVNLNIYYRKLPCILIISVNQLSKNKRAFGKLEKQKNVWSLAQISNSQHGTWKYSLLFLYWGHYFEVWTLKYARTDKVFTMVTRVY